MHTGDKQKWLFTHFVSVTVSFETMEIKEIQEKNKQKTVTINGLKKWSAGFTRDYIDRRVLLKETHSTYSNTAWPVTLRKITNNAIHEISLMQTWSLLDSTTHKKSKCSNDPYSPYLQHFFRDISLTYLTIISIWAASCISMTGWILKF